MEDVAARPPYETGEDIRMESRRLTSEPGRRARLLAGAALATAAFVAAVVPSMASAESRAVGIQSAASVRKADLQHRGTASPAARRAQRLGYLVPNPQRYERQKARAARAAEAREALASPAAGGPLAPSKIRSWTGINNPNNAPPDETSAVGTSRYIELVNSNFAIYNKTGTAPIGTGTLNNLVGALSSDDVFDPQIMWDATTKRFYYAADQVVTDTNNKVAFGFSKTASPSSAADWCKYTIGFGSTFADYPKLGDSQFFLMFGTNLFNSSGNYVGSDVAAITKPKGSDSCATYANTAKFDDKVVSAGFTPTPASEIDNNGTGWAVARTLGLPSTQLKLYKVTRNGTTGAPVIATSPTSVTVPSYTVPPPIPQKGTPFRIDSSDTRNTQAQAAIDPGHGNKFALWTQHTVRGGVGGTGAEVRWYEINPANHTVIQKGKATSPSLYEFNGAIAPNRQVNGSTKGGGSSMLMNFNTSSSTTFPSVKMVSKVGGGAQSAQIGVFTGTKPLTGFDCTAPAPDPCRWGDYAAATPDPSTANRIWNVSQFGNGTASSTSATSKTLNFVAKP
jgi:hypothetical protein